jgi:acetoacetyl-CoA synthetase
MTDASLDAPSEGGVTESPPPLWRPSQDRVARSAVTSFGAFVKERFSEVDVSTYEALHHWSITATDDFWRCIWDHCEVIASEKSDVVVRDADKMPGASWFPDGSSEFC